jgi:poly-gamma-glutamate capsule biosynthesis protein CapA/YwtB (metallophosphatase superfamily)
MRSHIYLLAFILFVLLVFVPEYNKPAEALPDANAVVKDADSIITATVSFTGDLMCHTVQYDNSKNADGSYDFNPSFAYIKNSLQQSDITMGNLELTFAGNGIPYTGYPTFNAPDAYADAIKSAGFDFVVTANNHSMDTEEKGLLRTLEILDKKGIGHTGTFHSQADHDSVRILNIKGIRLGVLNYTYGTNGAYPATDHRYMLNVIDTLAMEHDIKRARRQGAELVLVYFHYGKENVSEPTDAQKQAVNKSREYGADIIIGGHPHVISPVNYYKTVHATLDSGIVAWSLGNFISNQYHRYTDAGLIFTLTLRKNKYTHKFSKPSASYLPTWVYRANNPAMHKHIVFPAELAYGKALPAFLDSSCRRKMKEAFEDTKALMGKYSPSIRLEAYGKK